MKPAVVYFACIALLALFSIAQAGGLAHADAVFHVEQYGSGVKAMNEFYVASNGSDASQGTKEQPFATLERARDAIREMKQAGGLPAGGVTVWVRGGVYPRTRSFLLSAEDSGTPEGRIVYRAYEDEVVRLVGAKHLGGFSPVKDAAVLARLCPEARQKVVKADLKAQGVADLGQLRSRGFGRPVTPSHLQVFFDGETMQLARYPNEGFLKIAGFPEQPPQDDGFGGKVGALEKGFLYEGDRPKGWKKDDDIWVHGYWAWDWANSFERVADIDTSQRLVRTAPPYGLYSFRVGQRFFFLNILEELDQPGEYYVDRATGILYFWPPSPIKGHEVYASVLEEPLVKMSDASYVTFRGLTLEFGRGTAIEVKGGRGNLVGGCTIRHMGNCAALIEGGSEHRVDGCDIYDLGDAGIVLDGGDRKTLTPGGHCAINNHIHHIGQWSRCYQPAVRLIGVGNRVAHNLIHDGPHCAILLNGNDHLIEFNEIQHVCLETADVGAFYLGRDWTERGNVVRYNFFHDLGGVQQGSVAVYLDDCASGTTVYGNVCYHAQWGVLIGGGRDNIVENNVFYDCTMGIHVDGRGLDPHTVWHGSIYQTMKERLEAMDWQRPPYSERYPALSSLEKYYQAEGGVPPEGDVIRHNISVGGQWLDIGWFATPEMVDVRDNLVDADPHFVNPGSDILGFRLKDDSPALKLGFRPIPLESIGLHKDEFRRELP